MPNLDDLYGQVVVPRPDRVGLCERIHRPRSATILNRLTAPTLIRLMRFIEAGRMGDLLNETASILWIIDEDGRVHIAWEEISRETGVIVVGPMALTLNLSDPFYRLGHPSLVSHHRGRIGGELIWDENGGLWFLNNKSGRYGSSSGGPGLRTTDHLENAARIFRQYDIEVTASFM